MIGLIIIIALFLRLVNLNQSLWLDEAIQFKAAGQLSLTDLFRIYLPTDFNPPLSYLINFGFGRVLGFSEIALRFPSVIFGVLTVWLVYRLGGKWPALLLATSGLHIYYSQEARMYSLTALAVTGSFYFLKQKNWPGYVLASLAAVYSHYLTVFIFPAQWFWVKKKYWLLIILGYLPWLSILFRQLTAGTAVVGTVWGGVIGGLTLKNLLLVPVKFLIGRISIDNNYLFAAVMAVPLMLAGRLVWRGIKANKFYAAWLVVPAVLIAAVSLFLPVLAYFRLLYLLPAFYLLATVKPAETVLAGWVVFNLITSGIYLFHTDFHREDWRGLVRRLDSRPVAVIAAVDAPLKYYWAGPVVSTEVIPEQDFWYVAYAEPIFDSELKFRRRAAAAGFRENSSESFRGGLTLIEYRR